ncbi:hypothetical protein EK904_012491, partial [Melospiza melodia maxima]
MNENVSSSAQSCGSAAPCNNSSAIPQPSSAIKPWRSKSLSAKHTATSSMLSVKQPPAEPPKPPSEIAKAAPNAQKSMLEKLKLFNSKGGSKAGVSGTTPECPGSRDNSCEKLEALLSFEESEEIDATSQNVNNLGSMSSSPKIALKGIAQRTFSRALTNKKSSPKGNEKEKEKQKEKEKDKSKDITKRTSITEKLELKEEPKEEQTALTTTAEMPKKSSKIASFIPKGGKLNSAKKEASAPSHSGIPKPGMKNTTGKSSSAPVAAKEGERSRGGKASAGLSHQKSQLDGRHSSSSSSLASSEGKGAGGLQGSSSSQAVNGPAVSTHTTGSNTVSVQLPQPQAQYSHPNTATVAPFMYRSQTGNEGNVTAEASTGGVSMDSALYVKTAQPALEDLSGEDPETRRLRTVKNIADLRQNLEETIGRSILSLTGRPTPLSWRLGQSSPRLQAGDAPSPGSAYLPSAGSAYPPRGSAGRFGSAAPSAARYLYPAPLRRQLATRGSGLCHVDIADKAADDIDLEGVAMDATGYMSDGDYNAQAVWADWILKGVLKAVVEQASSLRGRYLTDGGLGLYTRRLTRLPDGMATVRETLQRGTALRLGDAD